jgi:hypothetical protein
VSSPSELKRTLQASHIKALRQVTLDYHAQAPTGWLSINTTKPLLNPQGEQLPSDGFAATNQEQPMSLMGRGQVLAHRVSMP